MVYEWLQHIKFLWPENFILLALVPFLVWKYAQTNNNVQGKILFSANDAALPKSIRTKLRHLPFILRILAVICLMIALARPQHLTMKTREEGEGIDIVLCLDVSGSMLTSDVKPYRFAVAKEVAIDFVKNRPTDRIGVVVFSGEAFTKCPLTPDKNTVLQQLESLKIMDGGYLEPGTLIGEGLATSVNRISKGSSKSRVVILLTDGKEDAPPTRIIDPDKALQIAKANNVKVYCIGLGANNSIADQMVEGYKGAVIRNYLDEGLLEKIATETGGKYYHAVDKSSLQSIYNQIDRLEKTKIEVIKSTDAVEMFFPLVLLSLFFLFMEVVLRYTVLKRFP